MRKNILWFITVVLSVTLVGLIIVQTYWIQNAIDIKEEQFNQNVRNALDNIIREIENREMVYQVVNEMEPVDDISPIGTPSINYSTNKLSQKAYQLSTTDQEKEVFVIHKTDSISISSQLQSLGNQIMQLNSKTGFKLNETSNQKIFGNTGYNMSLNEKLNNRTVFIENVVNKYIQVDIELEDRINKDILEEIIDRSLRNLGIDIGYEYAVSKNNYKTIYKSAGYTDDAEFRKFAGKLFPNDVFVKNNYIYLYFPEQRNFIVRSTGFMAFSSVFLTLIILVGFSLTIHIMFKQKRLSQIKNDFVNNMTHELKTPISTISLASQMLKDDSIPIESKNIAYISNIIDDESKRLSFQVEKVLKTALFDQGQMKLKRKEHDVHQIIENVIKNFDIQVKSKNGQLIKNLTANKSIYKVDEVHFTNIIFNLLDNAVKYSNGVPEIIVSTRDNNKGIYIAVSDKGIGIKKQDQKRIFDQFYRVSTGNVHDVKGFGLGLSYVKKIVDAHNGNIKLNSEYRKGTTFEIFIPNHIENGRK
jgi:two-component system phosphate regulon sensor histidine kinase PhoR